MIVGMMSCGVCQGTGSVWAVRPVMMTGGASCAYERVQCAACLGHGGFAVTTCAGGATCFVADDLAAAHRTPPTEERATAVYPVYPVYPVVPSAPPINMPGIDVSAAGTSQGTFVQPVKPAPRKRPSKPTPTGQAS